MSRSQAHKYNVERATQFLSTARESQIKTLEAIIKAGGSFAGAARELGVNESTVRKTFTRLDAKAAATQSPVSALNPLETPAGFSIQRISKHLDKEGNVSGWVIANRDKEDQFNAMLEAWENVCVGLERVKPIEPPKEFLEDLLCDYTIGDSHLGMYAWGEEAGEDWTLEHGVRSIRLGLNSLVSSSPAAYSAFLLDVGDYLHSDSFDNETRASGNKLDVDTRWSKVLDAAVQSIADAIDLMLHKHAIVYYRAAMGNHNEHSSIMMMMAIKQRYHNEPRVVVLDSPAIHHYFQFGVNLLADTHGHTTKADTLPILMATDRPQMWAETTNRIWRTGHVHHLSQKEYHGCTVITYRTLTPRDAWHTGQGYRSNREMQCTVYNRKTGRVGANFVNPSMIGM